MDNNSNSGDQPFVSVVIPTFNRAHFICDAVDSVLEQEFTNFEVIVVDDGSTDDTLERLAQISDPRLVVIPQDNTGRSNARNNALRRATGDYIAFLDSDDLFLPSKLSTQVDYLEAHPSVGMIYTGANCINEHGQSIEGQFEATVSGNIYKDVAFFRPVTIALPTVMLRREILLEVGDFDEAMERFEDTDMWRRVSKVTPVHGLPTPTCKIRTHSENHLENQDPQAILDALDYYAAKILKEDKIISSKEVKQRLGALYIYYSEAFATVPKWRGFALTALEKSTGYWPPKKRFRRIFVLLRLLKSHIGMKIAKMLR
ncbi:MAG: glycosyltransferase family 2 protein [Roseobacter sp.]